MGRHCRSSSTSDDATSNARLLLGVHELAVFHEAVSRAGRDEAAHRNGRGRGTGDVA